MSATPLTAWHEAGHACATAILMPSRLMVVSLRDGLAHAGVTI
jgi:hypothetical protein